MDPITQVKLVDSKVILNVHQFCKPKSSFFFEKYHFNVECGHWSIDNREPQRQSLCSVSRSRWPMLCFYAMLDRKAISYLSTNALYWHGITLLQAWYCKDLMLLIIPNNHKSRKKLTCTWDWQTGLQYQNNNITSTKVQCIAQSFIRISTTFLNI